MKKEMITGLTKNFEEAAKTREGVECWMARDLQERGVDDLGFARIRSKGDEALFGGNTTSQMKRKLNVPENRALADFLPTITVKAKDFASEITHFTVKKEGLQGEKPIAQEHVKNNRDVRQVLAKRNIYPEQLPPEEDIKKVERRFKTQDEKTLKGTGRLK